MLKNYLPLGVMSITALAVVVALWVVGAIAIYLGSPWSDQPGRELATRLQAVESQLIREVVFRPQTVIDPPEVHVILRPGATERDAELLWCEVIAPAGGSQFEGNTGTLVLDDSGNSLAANVTCPPGDIPAP